MGLRRIASAMAVALTIGLAGAGAAEAVTWASSASPLRATYLGVSYADAYGNTFRSGNYNRVSSYQRDPVANGNSVFVSSGYYIYNVDRWDYMGEQQTARTSSSSYVSKYTQSALGVNGTRAMAKPKVCEDFAGRPDICSVEKEQSYYYTY